MSKQWFRKVALALAPLGLLAPVAAAEEAPAEVSEALPAVDQPVGTPVVETFHETLIEVMKGAEALGYEGRRKRIAPLMHQLFDLPFMAEKCVGRHWRGATAEEQERLVDAFSRYTIANYAGRFAGYTGESFETLREVPSARGTRIVHTLLTVPDGDDVKLDYRLRKVGDQWRIVDIYLNGAVSELALRRAEYSSLIKREGIQALLAALDERVAELAAGGDSG